MESLKRCAQYSIRISALQLPAAPLFPIAFLSTSSHTEQLGALGHLELFRKAKDMANMTTSWADGHGVTVSELPAPREHVT